MKIDPNVLKQLGQTYGVWPINSAKGLRNAIQTGPGNEFGADVEPILHGGGYVWDDNENCYLHEDGKQRIYNFGSAVVWTLEDTLYRMFHPQKVETLKKWVVGDEKYPEGKSNRFMATYSKLTGGSVPSSVAKKPTTPAAPEKPFNKADSAVEEIEKTYKKRDASGKIIVPADVITDYLWPLAKELQGTDQVGYEKVMTLMKALTPKEHTNKPHNYLNEGKIKKSTLMNLIREIVKGIVKEVDKDEEEEQSTSGGAGAFATPKAFGKVKETSVTGAVAPVTTPYAFGKRKRVREFLGPLGGMEEKKQESDHPEQGVQPTATGGGAEKKSYRFIYVGEGSGNVYGVSNAPSIEQAWKEFQRIVVRTGEDASDAVYDKATIRHRDNGYWSISHRQSDEGGFWIIDIESNNPEVQREIKSLNLLTYADDYVAEHPLTETTTTMSGTPGYNVPGAFARSLRGGRKHIEVLGYTLTAAGEKEMNRKGDKLYEGKVNEYGGRLLDPNVRPIEMDLIGARAPYVSWKRLAKQSFFAPQRSFQHAQNAVKVIANKIWGDQIRSIDNPKESEDGVTSVVNLKNITIRRVMLKYDGSIYYTDSEDGEFRPLNEDLMVKIAFSKKVP